MQKMVIMIVYEYELCTKEQILPYRLRKLSNTKGCKMTSFYIIEMLYSN